MRQQTRQFIEQYKKQLLTDFHHHVAPSEEHHPYETIQSSLYHSKPSVQDTATDPNSVPVVHKDSGSPIFPPGVRNYHCPLHSSLTLHPLHQHHDNRHRSFYIQVAYIGVCLVYHFYPCSLVYLLCIVSIIYTPHARRRKKSSPPFQMS